MHTTPAGKGSERQLARRPRWLTHPAGLVCECTAVGPPPTAVWAANGPCAAQAGGQMGTAGRSGVPRRPLRRPGAPVACLAVAVALLMAAAYWCASQGAPPRGRVPRCFRAGRTVVGEGPRHAHGPGFVRPPGCSCCGAGPPQRTAAWSWPGPRDPDRGAPAWPGAVFRRDRDSCPLARRGGSDDRRGGGHALVASPAAGRGGGEWAGRVAVAAGDAVAAGSSAPGGAAGAREAITVCYTRRRTPWPPPGRRAGPRTPRRNC